MLEPSQSAVRGSLAFHWPEGVLVTTSGTYRDKQGIHSDVRIAVMVDGQPEHVLGGMLNLKAVRTRNDWQRKLTEVQPAYQWYEVLEYISAKAEAHLLQGKPALWLDTLEWKPVEPRLYPVLYKRQPTILFGDGGSGKSTVCLAIACAIASGGSFLGHQAEQGNVLYLDWEADDNTMARRLDFLKRAQEIHEHIPILYKRLYGLLSDQIDAIAQLCVEHDIQVVIVDALAKAIADAPEGASAALRFFDAMDSLERDYLIIDHIDKAKATPGKPYGSVFKYNSARAVWFASSTGEPNASEIFLKLEQTKANDMAKHGPIPIHILFTENQTVVERSEWAMMPEQVKPEGMTQWDRVREAMRGQRAVSAQEIAEATQLTVSQVQKMIAKHGEEASRVYSEGGKAYYRLNAWKGLEA